MNEPYALNASQQTTAGRLICADKLTFYTSNRKFALSSSEIHNNIIMIWLQTWCRLINEYSRFHFHFFDSVQNREEFLFSW